MEVILLNNFEDHLRILILSLCPIPNCSGLLNVEKTDN